MLLTSLTVYVPADVELDADLSEYGKLSLTSRATFGEAAAEAGAPDFSNEPLTDSVDAIANILHWVAQTDNAQAARDVLRVALSHFDNEEAA